MEIKTGFRYPAPIFDWPFECFLEWELVTVVAETNSWKTTFAMDIIDRNSKLGTKGFYINLEFPIETVWQNRWLFNHWKSKINLSHLNPLTDMEQRDMDEYVKANLEKFDYYNNPNGIKLEDLIKLIEAKAIEWYKLFVVDTFSKIEWNLVENPRANQNKCMEQLQELVQRLWVAIMLLHHTNRGWTFEGSQKIKDLSNVFIIVSKQTNWDWETYTEYELTKDKFITTNTLTVRYRNWEYCSV